MAHPSPDNAGPAATRDRIIAAARGLLAATPVAGLRMRDVAAAAGLSVSSIYQHFGAKADLLRAVWSAEAAELLRRCAEALEAGSAGIDGLVAFGYAVFNDFAGYVRNRARTLEFLQTVGRDDESARLVNESRDRLRELLRSSLSDGPPRRGDLGPDLLAELVLDAADGIALAELHGGNRHPADEIFGALLALIEVAETRPDPGAME
jgi:AcrR family transcriptional regulator